jgi:glycosyltransferase involved in cell wall biosynthesis
LPIELSIVIPAYNESGRLKSGYDRLAPALEALGPETVEVIVVDDGSRDGTGRRAAEILGGLPHSLVVRRETNQGKGAAVRLGFTVAAGPKIVVCDADMAIDPVHLPAVIAALDTSPLAFGSRSLDGAIHYDSWLRTRAGVLFNNLVRRVTSTNLRDTQCGFKGFRAGPARLLGALGLVDGFAYDVELLYLADLLDLGVTPVRVSWRDVAGSSVYPLRDSRRMIHDIRSLRRRAYECPVVRASADVDAEAVRASARAARQGGLVIARGEHDALVVLPRDAALAGVQIAGAVAGALSVAGVAELRGRRLEAV